MNCFIMSLKQCLYMSITWLKLCSIIGSCTYIINTWLSNHKQQQRHARVDANEICESTGFICLCCANILKDKHGILRDFILVFSQHVVQPAKEYEREESVAANILKAKVSVWVISTIGVMSFDLAFWLKFDSLFYDKWAGI